MVKRLLRQQTLPATQVVPQAPWIIKRTDLEWSAVQAEVKAVRAGRRRPFAISGEPELPFNASIPSDEENPSCGPVNGDSHHRMRGPQ